MFLSLIGPTNTILTLLSKETASYIHHLCQIFKKIKVLGTNSYHKYFTTFTFYSSHCPENISRQIVSDNYFYSGMLVLGTSFLRENKTKNLVEICFPHFKQLLDLSHFTFTVFLLVWPCQNRFFKKLKYQDI